MINEFQPWGMNERSYITTMHLSQLAGFIVPGLGFILPIIMWMTNKDESEEIDAHGRVILNWMCSALIYSILCWILVVIFIGLLGLFALGSLGLIFAIIGAVNANNGKLWVYPLSIKFFKSATAP